MALVPVGEDDLMALQQVDPEIVERKIEAINSMHAAKVRALMNSINKLQKENQEIKKASTSHKRSEAFKKMEAELGRQDVMIKALMRHIDERISAGASRQVLEQALAKGPPRVAVRTRQELVLELEDAQAKLEKASGNIRELRAAQESKGESSSGSQDKAASEKASEQYSDILNLQKKKIASLHQKSASQEVELQAVQAVLKQQTQVIRDLQRGAPRGGDGEQASLLGHAQTKVKFLEDRLQDAKDNAANLKLECQQRAEALGTVEREANQLRHDLQLKTEESEDKLREQAITFEEELIKVRNRLKDRSDKLMEFQEKYNLLNAEHQNQTAAMARQKEEDSNLLRDTKAEMAQQMEDLTRISGEQVAAAQAEAAQLKFEKEQLNAEREEHVLAQSTVSESLQELEEKCNRAEHAKLEMEGQLAQARQELEDIRAFGSGASKEEIRAATEGLQAELKLKKEQIQEANTKRDEALAKAEALAKGLPAGDVVAPQVAAPAAAQDDSMYPEIVVKLLEERGRSRDLETQLALAEQEKQALLKEKQELENEKQTLLQDPTSAAHALLESEEATSNRVQAAAERLQEENKALMNKAAAATMLARRIASRSQSPATFRCPQCPHCAQLGPPGARSRPSSAQRLR